MIVSLLTGFGFVLSLISGFLKTRASFLLANSGITGASAAVSFLQAMPMAGVTYVVACVSSLVQLLLGDKQSTRLNYIRIGVATGAVLIVAPLVYQTPYDLLVIVGVLLFRVGEVFTDVIKTKASFLAGNVFFLIYFLIFDSIQMLIIQGTVSVFLVIGIAVDIRRRKKQPLSPS